MDRLVEIEVVLERVTVTLKTVAEMQERTTKNIANLEEEIKKLYTRDGTIQVLEGSCKSAHKRLDKMERNASWVIKTILGTVIVAVMTLLYRH